MVGFLDLDEYALMQVFEFLSELDLVNLSMTNSLLTSLVNNFLKTKIRKKLMICNSTRSPVKFTSVNLLKINRNWLDGRYLERICLRHKPLFLCHIQITATELIKSHGTEIRAYRRETNGFLNEKPFAVVNIKQQADVTHFVMREGKIFAGNSNGTCSIYDMHDKSLTVERVYSDCEFINSVDFKGDIYVTMGKVKAKILKMETELGMSALEQKYEFPYVFQTCRLHRNRPILAAGKYSDRRKKALCIIDVETGHMDEMDSNTGAIYDMLWKDENCLMTANFDSTLRITDIRTKRDELVFRDIYNSSIYCIDYDGNYGCVCGMKYFRVNLYDIRVTNRFQQMYFPKRTSFNNSPVYSIQCDNSQLFIQTDTNLRILNFNSDYTKSRDYSNMNLY